MKTRKLLALALAFVMTFSLASMAFAAGDTEITTSSGLAGGGTTTGTGEAKALTINVTVPGTQNFVINPYGLAVTLTIDGQEELSTEQIFCAPLAVVSQSYVPIQVSASVKGTPQGGLNLKETPEEANPNWKEGFEYSEYDISESGKNVYAFVAFAETTSNEEGEATIPEFPTEYEEPADGEARTILITTTQSDDYVVATLSAMTSDDGEEYHINERNAVAFTVYGCADPFEGDWSSNDKLTITTTFSFQIAI